MNQPPKNFKTIHQAGSGTVKKIGIHEKNTPVFYGGHFRPSAPLDLYALKHLAPCHGSYNKNLRSKG